MLRLLLPLVLIGAIVAAVVFFVFGGSDSDDDSTSSGSRSTPTASATVAPDDEDLTAQDVLDRAADAVQELESFHFVLTHEDGSTPLPLGLELTNAEGDVEVPDALSAEVDAEALGGLNVGVDVIGIDDRTWITNPFSRQWEELEGTNIRDFADPVVLVSDLAPLVTPEELTDGGRVDGVETHLVTGTIDSGDLSDALGIAEPGREVGVEAWIGTEDFVPRRLRLIGPLSDDDSPDVVRQVDISRIDEPVEIMPPE